MIEGTNLKNELSPWEKTIASVWEVVERLESEAHRLGIKIGPIVTAAIPSPTCDSEKDPKERSEFDIFMDNLKRRLNGIRNQIADLNERVTI